LPSQKHSYCFSLRRVIFLRYGDGKAIEGAKQEPPLRAIKGVAKLPRATEGVFMTTTILEDIEANQSAYQQLSTELERTHWHQWIVIARGNLLAIAPSREEALQQAGNAAEALSRLVRKVGEELPTAVRKL
jgi:hypothetical protein